MFSGQLIESAMAHSQHESKTKLLDATLKVVRAKGYNATRIEDVCTEAGLTKGSFFHHFKSKEDLGLAAVAHWDAFTTQFFAAAPYHDLIDPLDRLLAYVDLRKAMITGELPAFTCFAGTIVQEAYITHPEIVASCEKNISGHVETLEADIRKAMWTHGVRGEWTSESLALHIQAVIQGAFVLAKAKGTAAVAIQSLDHLRRYLELLFAGSGRRPFPRSRSGQAATERRPRQTDFKPRNPIGGLT
jgi:TetR/AcrR family transcriptional repressor of nem operon